MNPNTSPSLISIIRFITRWLMIGGTMTPILLGGTINLVAEAQSSPDFSGTGRPGSRVGGASRQGRCATPEVPLMSLTPADANYGGRTIRAQPIFWVYTPYAIDSNNPMTFSIVDEEGNDIYQATSTKATLPGIYGIQLPDSVELSAETYYDWYVLIYCNDPMRQHVPAFAGGWVQRISPPHHLDLSSLETSLPVEESHAFAAELLWYDAIAPLGEALHENSSDLSIQSAWTELLSLPSVKLDDFTDVPVTFCCDINQLELTHTTLQGTNNFTESRGTER